MMNIMKMLKCNVQQLQFADLNDNPYWQISYDEAVIIPHCGQKK